MYALRLPCDFSIVLATVIEDAGIFLLNSPFGSGRLNSSLFESLCELRMKVRSSNMISYN